MQFPRIMIAAPASGSGKTVASCALMAGFWQMHKNVRACKCGPDYIDPMFHREVLGVDSENLDLFFSGAAGLKKSFQGHAKGADLTIVEGVMGYYDGIRFGSTEGSAYAIGKELALPVILVLPCNGMAASVLAILKGLLEYRSESNIRGIILNWISPALYPRMKEMIEQGLAEMGHTQTKVVGYLPEDDAFFLSSRHLGLVTPEELPGLKKQMERAGKLISETVDLAEILRIAGSAEELEPVTETEGKAREKGGSVRIAVARDRAFCFYYKQNLDCLRELGCELAEFSPLESKSLPGQCDGLLLGGGYPELYGKELSLNQELMREIRERISGGMPCLAECGGFQYLQDRLEGADGKNYEMAGVIHSSSRKQGKLVRFGYVTVEAAEGSGEYRYLRPGEKIRGHEFHHWDSTDNGASCLAVKPDGRRRWACIHAEGNLFAGYPHLYYPSCPEFAARFVEACLEYKSQR